MTPDLIDRLSADLKPIRATTLVEQLALVIIAGIGASVMLMWAWLGFRPDMLHAIGTPIFWVKSAFTFILSLVGAWGVERLSRGDSRGIPPLLSAAACFAIIAGAAIIDYVFAPAQEREQMLMGSSASVCSFYIVALSTPFLTGSIAFMRRLAPTNLPLAGAAAGLLAGALGAWVYSFHCLEQGLPFLASWYSLGIAVVVMLGASLGKPLLRW